MGTETGFSQRVESFSEEEYLTLKKLDNIFLAVCEHSRQQIADVCVNQVEAQVLLHDPTSHKEFISILNIVASRQQPIRDSDLVSLICEMSAQARERSKGGAILHKVFLRKDIYKNLLETNGVADAKKCVIAKAEIVLSNEVTRKCPIVGLCRSKFDIISSDLLVITGEIDAN
jgi:hypothetical protein